MLIPTEAIRSLLRKLGRVYPSWSFFIELRFNSFGDEKVHFYVGEKLPGEGFNLIDLESWEEAVLFVDWLLEGGKEKNDEN